MKKIKKGMRRFSDSVEAYACLCACACSCSCGILQNSANRKLSAQINGYTKTTNLTDAANKV